jgi:hypothetical protein
MGDSWSDLIFEVPWRALALAALATVAAVLALATTARAQTYTVSNLSDSGVAEDGSLRGAVRAANQHLGPDTVAFAPGLSGTIDLSGSGLTIKEAVDVEGPGPAALTVRQLSGGHRVFLVELTEPGAVTIAGLRLTGGNSPGPGGDVDFENEAAAGSLVISDCLVDGGESEEDGGGINAVGSTFTLRDSVVTENEADGGGGLWVGGDVTPYTIEDSTVSGNQASGDGGGMIGEIGVQNVISGSTFAGNISGERGGGALFSLDTGRSLRIVNSTFAGNHADDAGGGIFDDSGGVVPTTTIEDSTIVGNDGGGSPGDSGGLFSDGPTPQVLVDTIVAGNVGAVPDLSGRWTTSFSLLGNPTGATLTEAVPGSDLLGVDPQLGPLRSNGGPTETMAPGPKSPAIDKGGGSAVTTDQRGAPRPVDYLGIASSAAPGADASDIGAVELASPPASVAPSPPPPPPAPPAAHKVSFRLHCPKSAGHGGCRFALQAVSAKPKRVHGKLRRPQPESAVARTEVAAGAGGLLTLKPKPKFAARLDAATKVLVREVETVKGESHTSYRRLKVTG